MNAFEIFVKFYKSLAIIFLSACILVLLLNIVLFVIFKIRDTFFKTNFISEKYGSLLEKFYPELSKKEIKDLLNETWTRPYMYEPFTQFKERVSSGKYVNVSKNGFRIIKNQGPWPPKPSNYNIFVFGGSISFGYGVSDEQTTPSYLQEILSNNTDRNCIRVYNFGRGHYYSILERILFEKLLVDGFTPNMAIFIDGLNDFCHFKNEPFYTKRLVNFIEGKFSNILPEFMDTISVMRVFIFMRRFFTKSKRISKQDANTSDYKPKIAYGIDRYLKNKKLTEAISEAHGVTPIFVWEPIPTYKYDLKYHILAKGGFKEMYILAGEGYSRMAELIQEKPLGNNFLWCADIQDGLKETIYIDLTHYSARMCKKLAAVIHGMLLERNLLSP